MDPLIIKTYPENVLRTKSKDIIEVTEREKTLFEKMLYTMRQVSGIGLAAPQVGINQRIIVIDIGQGPIKLANPEIIKAKGADVMEEGCLSVPGALVDVRRPSEVIVKALNEQGKIIEIKADGLLARVLLHEIDHLNGKLIIDYMNFLKKLKFKLSGGGK